MKETKIEVENSSYTFPKSDIEAIVQDQGQTLIRLHRSNDHFKLFYNSRSDREQRQTGRLVISGVSDQFGKFESIESPVGTVVCKNTPYWSCGFALQDGSVRWSVVFDRQRVGDVKNLKEEALNLLSSYRSR